MNRTLHRLAMIVAALSLAACVVYEPIPGSTPQQRFDRSWAAAAGAINDNGLTITTQDRSTGVIRGERGGVTITAAVETLPDGRIQVKFFSTGETKNDPYILTRVTDSYNQRMGR
jgi:hypothetical protein